MLPPKRTAKRCFVCSLLQVLVWSIGFTKANFILQWFQCVTLQAGAEAALRLQRIAEECSNGAWQARGTCSKWVHCGLRVNNFSRGFDLALVCMQPLLGLPNQLMKASLVLNTLWIEWSASATGQLFKTLCQAKTLAGASIEDGLNTRHETDLSIDIRILKVSWFPGSSHDAVLGFSLCSSLSQTLDWCAGSSRWTIWQLWFAEARKSFEMDRKWSNVSVLFSKTRPLLWAGFLAGLGHHHIMASGSKGRWLCWDPASMRRSPSRVPSRGGFEAMLGPSKLGRDMQRHVCVKYAHPYSYIKYIAMILLMEEIPNNHLTCMKPCKEWDIYHINCLTGFLFHQQYLYLQLNSPWFWSTPRWRGLSRCLEVGNKVSLRGVCYLSGGVKGSCIFLLILMNFDGFWDQVGEDFARFCGACPQHERPRAQIWVTLVESETGDWCGFLDGWLPQIPLVHHASKKIATLQWFLMRQKYEQGMSNRWIIGVWRALNLLFTTQAALGMSEERVNWWLRLMTYFPSKP